LISLVYNMEPTITKNLLRVHAILWHAYLINQYSLSCILMIHKATIYCPIIYLNVRCNLCRKISLVFYIKFAVIE
jgi:hypothetical protein